MKKYRVLLLDTKASNPNHYICLAIEDALKKHPEVELVCRVNLGNAIQSATSYKCNLFFAFDGEEINPEVCYRLKEICGIALVWFTEDPYELPKNIVNSNLFDLVFTNDKSSVKDYKTLAFHLPLAASRKIQYHPVASNNDALYDLFFAGTAWPNRVDLIDQISKKISGIKLKIALSTNEHLPPISLPIKKSAYSWKTPNSEFARISNLSRATLSIHRDFSTCVGAKTKASTPGPRLFEVAMAGGFQLIDSSLNELNEYFSPGKEIITFNNIDECKDKLNYFLKNPNERLKIALAAQNRSLRDHTYLNRIDFILKKLKNLNPILPPPPKGDRPKVLIVGHNLLNRSPWGGTEIYIEWIRKNLADDFELYFYTPQSTVGDIYLLQDSKLKVLKEFKLVTPYNRNLLSCPEREKIFSKILIEYNIDTVHFQHLINHAPSLPIIANTLGVGTLKSLHDFYSICDNFNFVGSTNKYCGLENQTVTGCDDCLSTTHNALPGSQSIRRNFFNLVLEKCDAIQANSADTLDKHKLIYGKNAINPIKATRIGVPIDRTPLKTNKLSFGFQKNLRTDTLNVAVLGNFSVVKGGHFYLQIFKQLVGWPVHFYIFGRVDPPFKEIFQDSIPPNVTLHGAYQPKELSTLLTGMNVSVHNSIWPETYCLTLSEAWNAKLIPIVSDIGALGERVIDSVNGFKFPPENVGAAVDILRYLSSNPSLISRMAREIKITDLSYASEHKEWLKNKYFEISRLHTERSKRNNKKFKESEISLVDCGIYLNDPQWLKKPQ